MYRLIGSVHTLGGLPRATSDFLRAMDSVRKQIATDAGLSTSELRAMASVAEAEGVTPKRVAEDLEVTTGAITAITNRLVARGLLVRVEQPHDRRSLLLELTDEGHALMESTYTRFQSVIAAASSRLSDADRTALVDSLEIVAGELEK